MKKIIVAMVLMLGFQMSQAQTVDEIFKEFRKEKGTKCVRLPWLPIKLVSLFSNDESAQAIRRTNSFSLNLIKLSADTVIRKKTIKKLVLHHRWWGQQWLHNRSVPISSPLLAASGSTAPPAFHTHTHPAHGSFLCPSPRSTMTTSPSSFEFPSKLTFSLTSNLTTPFIWLLQLFSCSMQDL